MTIFTITATPCPRGVQSPHSDWAGVREANELTSIAQATGEAVEDAIQKAARFDATQEPFVILVQIRNG